jgi:hypothetical protein
MFVIGMLLAAPHLHGHDLVLLVIPVAFFLKASGELTPWTASALVICGMLPIINNIVEAPPLLTIALLTIWAMSPKRLKALCVGDRGLYGRSWRVH